MIVILDGYTLNPGDLSWDAISKLDELKVYDRTTPDEVITRLQNVDIALTNKVVLSADVIDRLPSLRYIGVLATGYNVVDLESAKRNNIIVTNIPSYSTNSVAQCVFAHLLNITNRTAHYVGLNRQGKWSQSEDFCYMDTTLTELSGKTMGIVGLGNIGSAVSRIAHAFGMNVLAYTSKTEVPSFIHKIDLGGLFHNSDVISLHCPLTDATLKMVNSQLLSTVKPGAILINTSRGQIIDELAVAEALRSGTLGAFAADVLSQEPPLITNPLQTAPNVFITPHIAWATQEARRRLLSICSDNIVAFLNGHPQNVVNP